LKLNGTHQFVVYANDVNTLRGKVHFIKERAEFLIVASNGCRLEENVDKTKYMACLEIRMQDEARV